MSTVRSISLLLTLFLLLSSCGDDCTSQCRQRYSEGYSAGEAVGYNRGYGDGYTEGESVGFRSGYLSGGKTFIEDSFLPSLTGAALVAIIIVLVVAFKAVISRTFGGILKEKSLWLYNFMSYIALRRKVTTLEKRRIDRANIVARISALEIISHVTSLSDNMEYNNEFTLILSKIEQYMVGLHESSRQSFGDEIRKIADDTLLLDGLDQGERQKLLNAIRLVLVSGLSEIENLTAYEGRSYEKISQACYGYLKHRTRYRISYKLGAFVFWSSLSVNMAALFMLYLYIYNIEAFYAAVSNIVYLVSLFRI